jgi:hypothetical protein
MHSPLRVALIAAFGFGLFFQSVSIGSETVDRARALLKKDDPKAAIALLESALPTAGADLGPIIVVLRQSYTKAADLAKKAGRNEEAEEYRENLQILNRRMREKPDEVIEAPKATAPKVDSPRVEAAPQSGPASLSPPAESQISGLKKVADAAPVVAGPVEQSPAPPSALLLNPPAGVMTELDTKSNPTNAAPPVDPPTIAQPAPSLQPQMPVASLPSPEELLEKADKHYLAQQYVDANVVYSELAKQELLPDRRKIHWAYCRSVAVMKRIKAEPSTPEEWAGIHTEIAEIKALSPKYWYGEYLKNRAEDQSKAVAKVPQKPIIRGAMPEVDSKSRPLFGKTPKAGGISMAVPSTETPAQISSYGDAGKWQIKETENFVIFHADVELAERVAKAAESTRETQTRRWSGSPAPRPWSPRCEIYVYPTATIFAKATNQDPASPGFSTMGDDGAKVTTRRINLRADHPAITYAVLPHEVTHVVLADLFPSKTIPRWADEGIAVLSEPGVEQDRRIAQLTPAFEEGKIFSLQKLMQQDYSGGAYWPLYYAQSVSLTKYLVEVGSPAKFIEFLQAAERTNLETELKRLYQIEDFAELQTRWLEYARSKELASK